MKLILDFCQKKGSAQNLKPPPFYNKFGVSEKKFMCRPDDKVKVSNYLTTQVFMKHVVVFMKHVVV